MWPKPFVTRPVWPYRPTRFNSNHPWRLGISHHPSVTADSSYSVASTRLMTSMSSLNIMVIFSMIPVDLSQEATWNWGPCRTLFDKSLERSDWQIDYMQYGLDTRAFTIAITDAHIFRYCVPMDNQRPELDLKHFKDICPDQNGTSV